MSGVGDFTGTFYLFKGGRELKGSFVSPLAGVNDWRFPNLRGSVLWLPDRLEITNGAQVGVAHQGFGSAGSLDFSLGSLRLAYTGIALEHRDRVVEPAGLEMHQATALERAGVLPQDVDDVRRR
ncbi:MAG: hypothetical protein HC774_00940 [Sphingomonadales bacterium]|nr:hypothetical protein [Sphingomonadales bacterium]